MNRILLLCAGVCLFTNLYAQNPPFLGAGNSSGISVETSNNYQDPTWSQSSAGINTINDQGMLVDYFEASRFLQQATLGYTDAHVQDVMSMGIEAWIDDQISKPIEYISTRLDTVMQVIHDSIDLYNATHGTNEEYPRRPNWVDFNYAWWQTNSTNNDLLRQKIAAALSEITIISRRSELGEYGEGLAHYYDKLLEGAFGNYRTVLDSITWSPMMGFYLSHLNNPPTDIVNNIHPDENYAREIMQLFSIGLYMLNLDGSRQLSGGNEIATYDNNDIKELARVLTGMGIGDHLPHLLDEIVGNWDDEVDFGYGLWKANVTIPMKMWDGVPAGEDDHHEPGVKSFLGGTIPSGQNGTEDVEDAIGIIFSHPNVGPFIAIRLIQRLVKSNPSPAYVARVATVFNNPSDRGNMAAVVKAILMDVEARDCSYQMDDTNSKLKEPLFRYTQFSRAVNKSTTLNKLYWNVNYDFMERTNQDIMASPSVFNFFLYDDAPNGPINDQGLVAPEFKIHDSRTSVGYINSAYRWTFSQSLMSNWEFTYPNGRVYLDLTNLIPMADEPETLINWIDKHILGGTMSDRTRNIIRSAVNGYYIGAWNWEERRVEMALYLALISPDYTIMR